MATLLEDLKKFNEEDHLCFLWGDIGEGTETIEDEIVDQSRWTTWHRAIVKRGDEYVGVDYGLGSTEMQENDEDVDFYEVRPVEVTVIKYEKV